jgi:hypothetical protein
VQRHRHLGTPPTAGSDVVVLMRLGVGRAVAVQQAQVHARGMEETTHPEARHLVRLVQADCAGYVCMNECFAHDPRTLVDGLAAINSHG